MRILCLPSIVSRADFGGSVHFREVFQNIAKSHDITAIAQEEHGLATEDGDHGKVIIVRYPNSSSKDFVTKVIKRIVLNIKMSYIGLKELSKTRYDVLHVRHGSLTLLGVFFSKMFRVPMVLEVNGLIKDEGEMSGWGRKTPASFAIGLIDRIGINNSKKIITVTEGLKENIAEDFDVQNRDIAVVPNGANTSVFRAEAGAKEKLGLPPDKRYVVFVGNLEPWQGVNHLMEAAPDIIEKMPDTVFIVVGGGICLEELKKLAKDTGVEDHVIFTGDLPYASVPLYINAGDVCVAPFTSKRNLKIGLSPLKVYEYLACGKAVVASDIPGVGDFIEKHGVGIKVRPDDSSELAQAVVKLLGNMKNEKLRTSMAIKGRRLVEENFTWKKSAERIVSVLLSASGD